MDISRYHAAFPASAEGVRAARGYAWAVAAGSTQLRDVELVAAELALCAMRHSVGGAFTMTVLRDRLLDRVRIEATTHDGKWSGDEEDEVAHGCRLIILDGVADRFGHCGVAHGRAITWAEMSLT